MNIPTIFDWIARFDFLRGEPAVLMLLLTSLIIALFWDWRVALFALTAQYLIAGLLVVDFLDPRLAIIKVLVGMFVCLILYFTARQVDYGHLPDDLPAPEMAPAEEEKKRFELGPWSVSRNTLVHTLIVVLGLIIVLIVTRATSFSLPGIPDGLPYINDAVITLMGMGIIGIVVSQNSLPAGMALFTFLTGFELYYAALEQTIAILIVLAALNFALALAISYLSQARRASWYKLSND
ncbi:MAG: hypothetical protein R3293_15345 [Candidatus Promineifilaceae bacterium]|nr:hypothetical protein [Candidatus Promineifilaceae bacterium]